MHICRGQKMFEEITTYISSKENLSFAGWTCQTGLVLPNVKSKTDLKKNMMEFKHKVITSSDDMLTECNVVSTHNAGKEYAALAKVLVTSIHGAPVKNEIGALHLLPVISDVERAHCVLAGKDAPAISPGFNMDRPDELSMYREGVNYASLKGKPATSLPNWLFWSPKQAEIIMQNTSLDQEWQRVIIQGPYGAGKTQLLMALALEAVKENKQVWFWSMLPEINSQYNTYSQKFCADNNITFCSKSKNPQENELKIREFEDGNCECLFIDELQILQETYMDDKSDDYFLR